MKRVIAWMVGLAAICLLGANIASASETIAYTYDALGRLAAVQSSGDVNDGQAASTTYDAAGNRTNQTVTGVATSAVLSIGEADVTEGGTLSFTVTRSGITSSAVSADYVTGDGSATQPDDYTAKSGTVNFAAHQATATITVSTSDDTLIEGDETMSVTLSNASSGATIATVTGTGTINDNDVPAQLAIGDANTTEGGTLSFTVTRSGDTSNAVSASYATSDGSAVAPGDYTATSGIVNFAANQTAATVSVTTIDDSSSESAETMAVTLSNPSTGAVLGDVAGTGTINDNDGPSGHYWTVSDAAATEGSNLIFTVTLNGPGTGGQTYFVLYQTVDGNAVAGSDYSSAAYYVQITPGHSQNIIIHTRNDSVAESTETMSLVLSSPQSGTTIYDGTGTGTIDDNDAP